MKSFITDDNWLVMKKYIILPITLFWLTVNCYGVTSQEVVDGSINVNKESLYKIEWIKVIYRQDGKYIGWPTLAFDHDQMLYLVFSGDRKYHVDPFGKIFYMSSSDFGETWSEPKIISDSIIDDRDAGIIITRKKTIIVNFFTSIAFADRKVTDIHKIPHDITKIWKEKILKINPCEIKKDLGNWIIRSIDNGKHWTAPVRTIGRSPHGPIQLYNGGLLLVGKGLYNSVATITVELSTDDGKSWSYLSEISIPSSENINYLHEPHVVETRSHKLVALLRNEPVYDRHNSYMRQSESFDMGKTWTPLTPTPLLGFPPHLLLLNNGWILATYGRRAPPFSIRACISKDEGETWDVKDEIILSHSPDSDFGYPSSVQLPDKSILTIYYQRTSPKEKPCLIGTRWRLTQP